MEVEVLGIFVLLCIDNAVFLMFYFLHLKRNKEMYGFVTDGTQYIYMYINMTVQCSCNNVV